MTRGGNAVTFYPDMGNKSMIAQGDHVRAVGWLHPDHAFPQGDVPAEFLRRLREFARLWSDSTNFFGWAVFRGFHICEFCRNSYGYGNFGVPAGEVLFVAPELIVHYVEEHHYAPPDVFIRAVLSSPLPGTREYEFAVWGFRHLDTGRVQFNQS